METATVAKTAMIAYVMYFFIGVFGSLFQARLGDFLNGQCIKTTSAVVTQINEAIHLPGGLQATRLR
jgi:hypothetical protein